MIFKEDPESPNSRLIEGEFKKRSDIHIYRKLWHITGVLLIFFLYHIMSIKASKIAIIVVTILFVFIDFIRKKNAQINSFFVFIFKPIIRKNEINGMAGTTYLFMGVMTVILFYHPFVTSLSLLFLAFADPFASFIGIKYGKDKIFGDKTMQGFIAAMLICFLLTVGYLFYYDFSMERILLISLISGVLGAVTELVPVGKIDDNFTIPVLSGLGLTAIFYVFGIL